MTDRRERLAAEALMAKAKDLGIELDAGDALILVRTVTNAYWHADPREQEKHDDE